MALRQMDDNDSAGPRSSLLPVRTGIWLFPAAGARELVDAAVAAEEGGFDEVWIADEGVMREPLVVLSAAAAKTSRIKLGIGITTPVLRHPGALGSSMATLDELSGGRAILGLGVGGALTLDPFGLKAEKPVALIRDAIRIARAVAGRKVAAGYDLPEHAMPPRDVPIFVASRGEQINRLASREADGVFFSGVNLDRVEETLCWARSVRPIHVALFPSVRYRPDAPVDPAALRGDPADVANGLRRLVERHHPETIGLCLVDGDPLDVMVPRAIDTLKHFREFYDRADGDPGETGKRWLT